MSELQLTGEQKVLVGEKNDLSSEVLNKYRVAGQIAQTGLLLVKNLLAEAESEYRSIGEICRIADTFLQRATAAVFSKSGVAEKGIALPVQIDKTSTVSGVSPEEGEVFQGQLTPGDLVKVSLGVHIDGYTAQVCHTTVVRDIAADRVVLAQGDAHVLRPKTGPEADAICAAHVAMNLITNMLSLVLRPEIPEVAAVGDITDVRIRSFVETVAAAFRVQVAPGSQVRRIRRFLAGQNELVRESDIKGVFWHESSESAATTKEVGTVKISHDPEFSVLPGEAWLIDIRMAATSGKTGKVVVKDSLNDNHKPTIYSRDVTVRYNLRGQSSRALFTRASALSSVYPFKLSHLCEDHSELRQARLGLSEIVQHHLFVPHPVKEAEFVSAGDYSKPEPVSVAREMSTVLIVPGAQSDSGYPELIRLTAGSRAGGSPWVHSDYEVTDVEAKALLAFRNQDKFHGIKFKAVQPSALDMDLADQSEMDIEDN